MVRAQCHTVSRGHAELPQLPLLLKEPWALQEPSRSTNTLWGRVGVSRVRLGPWLTHAVAPSLSFQICWVKGRDQMVTKIPSIPDVL